MANDVPKGRVEKDETFDEFLAGQGPLADTEKLAIKEILAGQIREVMDAQHGHDRAHEDRPPLARSYEPVRRPFEPSAGGKGGRINALS